MKKKRLIPFALVALVLLACRVVPAGMGFGPLARASATPSPAALPSATRPPASTETLEATAEPEATSTAQPTAAPSLAPFAPLLFREVVSQQEDPDKHTTIKLRYPGLDVVQPYGDGFNTVVQRDVDAAVTDFKKTALDASQFPADVSGSFMDLDYEQFYNQDGLVSLQLNVMVYIKGSAHPITLTIPINYDFRSGRELALADLFQPDSAYLELLSGLCSADLQTRDLPLFIEGAAPKLENYRSWNITPQGLRITFDPYQVAAYVAGPQIVNLDWSALRALLSSDLRLPLP